ncbi:efflux RND transporter periplasmic adaptor subunit, partial [Patescibacteria group bacterium]|nr:efflux RND transporter periplasmic adaptor subunit [Patescibacteria group bacterium]
SFFKSKKFYIPTALVVVLLSAYFYGSYKKKNAPLIYETIIAERGDLTQTVDATGKIESINGLSLRFELGGTLDVVKVAEGDVVKAGDLLASLRLAEYNAAVAQASANLNQKLAGATTEERDYYKAAMDMAAASLEQTKVDTANAVSVAESNLQTSKNNLKLAEGGENSQIVSNAYETSIATLQSSLSILTNGLTSADNILGIDNAFANDAFEEAISVLDSNKKIEATNNYLAAREANAVVQGISQYLTPMSSHTDIDSAITKMEIAFLKMNQLLISVSEVLDNTIPVANLTQASLETKKSTIDAARASVNTGYSTILTKKQSVADAKNSYDTFLVAYNKAFNDLTAAEATAVASVAAKQAAYEQAEANWRGKTVAPRAVDVAYYRAALSQAIANRDKATIKAPIDGIVTKVNKKRGEMVSMTDPVIEMLAPRYEVKVDIPETDVPKLSLENAVIITLDAFGEDHEFTGNIASIEPASTDIQDVVYYKVRVTLDDTDMEIMPGMTANVRINTADRKDVIIVPLRTVRTNGTKYVRLLVDGKEVERPVTIGLKGDDGKVEILEGLDGGEEVIVSIKAVQ